ncbi:MAG: hypothetical protein DI565_13025 [Ancylobacter novellus]|uniref:PD-(D/E)XK nuclease superfamily protein n=1 Tax=Ancylobacter novellus TaxID=921 RepID=A0A2W5KHK1_ANCNO|nr:MAG: hypothetical protein DI565_13025 [Ancylobacter novellus]
MLAVFDRSPLGWLRERDVDLLLCSELHARGEVASTFGEKICGRVATFEGAWVSISDESGESDLVVSYEAGGRKVVALVENKIAAGFQPEQQLRYRTRAARWAAEAEGAIVVTVLVAPRDYLNRPGAEDFDIRVSYEEVADALGRERDPRSTFFLDAVVAAVAQHRSGYVMTEDEAVTATWKLIEAVGKRVVPQFRFAVAGGKPSRSVWPYFRSAEGLSGVKDVVLVWKAERGQADLQFASTLEADLAQRCEGILGPGMSVVQASKSASVRVATRFLDFRTDPSDQEDVIVEGLVACERLRALFVENRARLLPR